ncbi:MAG TPA: PAS domain S-box protein [Planctomycetota bacterium]|nr:PAS domain S-box protein [Planctomycetota bacterium]
MALSSLPAVWVGASPSQVAGSLLRVIERSVPCDYVFVSLSFPDGQLLELSGPELLPTEVKRAWEQRAAQWRGSTFCATPSAPVADPAGTGDLRVAVIPLGHLGGCGVVVAGSRRPGFPTKNDLLLLNVACNHAGIVLQQRQSESSIRAAESRFRIVSQTVSDVVYELDLSTKAIAWFGDLGKLLASDQSVQAATLDAWHALIHPDDLQSLQKTFENCIATSGRFAAEYRIRGRHGQYRTLSDRAQLIRDASGKPARCVGAITDITEARRVEDDLRASKCVVENMVEGVSLSDERGFIVFTNPAEDQMFGYARGEMVGKHVTIQNSYPPEENLRIVEQVISQLKQKGEWKGEFDNRRKDGTSFTTHARITGLELRGRQYWMCVQQDITEKKRVEKALRNTEAQLSAIIDQSPLATYLVDDELRVRQINPRAQPVFGRESVIGRSIVEVLHTMLPKEAASLVAEQFSQTLRTGQSFVSTEFAAQRIDRGVTEFYDWELHRLTFPDGRHGVVCYLADVSARVEAEARLRESERRFRELADAMPQMVWTARGDGTFDYFNQRWAEFSGLNHLKLSTDNWTHVLHPDDLQPALDAWQRCLASGRPFEIEYRIREAASGEYKWHLGRALPIRDERGSVLRWIGTCTNIEPQKETENALKAADRHKDQFLAMLAHELRNPLAPIRNAAEYLRKREAADAACTRVTDIIVRQVDHMTHLVDDLLDMSRIARGKIDLHLELIDLIEVVRTAAEDHRTLLESKGLSLNIEICSGRLWVRGDRVRLSQVLGNVLHNAAKFTDSGGNVRIRVYRANDSANVAVRDSGIGMSAQTLDSIFSPFVQADETLDRSRGGLGLGLALAKGLVELHKGKMEAMSDGLGRGSEFVYTLPLALESEPDASVLVPENTREGAQKILIIEDNRDSAESLKMLLELSGNTVVVAADGPSGIEEFERFKPTMVLCDIGLPGMSGYEVVRALKAHRSMDSSILLVALTGYGQDEDKKNAYAAGFTHHLTKPVNLDVLEELTAAMKSIASRRPLELPLTTR